jgi:hypothetical protein
MKGQGTMTYKDGRFVEGQWNPTRLRDQKDRSKPSTASRQNPSGHGKIVWTDGSTYEGPHLDGVPHGSGGIFVSAEGDIQRGDFFYGACDAAKIKSTRKRSREITPPPKSSSSNSSSSQLKRNSSYITIIVVVATAVAVVLPVLIADLLRKRCRPKQMIVIGPLNVNDR